MTSATAISVVEFFSGLARAILFVAVYMYRCWLPQRHI
jgi:hypothetical protein